jgi:hypothetical protein
MLPRGLAQHLHRWVQGPYAALFDNVEDADVSTASAFDFEGLDSFRWSWSRWFYVLHRASLTIRTAVRTQLARVLDEAWRLRDATVRPTYEALRPGGSGTPRSSWPRNSDDFAVPCCGRSSGLTKMFLANPGMDLERTRELFT